LGRLADQHSKTLDHDFLRASEVENRGEIGSKAQGLCRFALYCCILFEMYPEYYKSLVEYINYEPAFIGAFSSEQDHSSAILEHYVLTVKKTTDIKAGVRGDKHARSNFIKS
jgi:hypothetical protein